MIEKEKRDIRLLSIDSAMKVLDVSDFGSSDKLIQIASKIEEYIKTGK